MLPSKLMEPSEVKLPVRLLSLTDREERRIEPGD